MEIIIGKDDSFNHLSYSKPGENCKIPVAVLPLIL
jgi:hypothetical protein